MTNFLPEVAEDLTPAPIVYVAIPAFPLAFLDRGRLIFVQEVRALQQADEYFELSQLADLLLG